MKNLLAREPFLLYYAIGVWIAHHKIAVGEITDLQSIQIMLISLIQFYNVTENLPEQRKIFCSLLSVLYKAVTSPKVRIRGLESIIDFVSKFYQSCELYGYINMNTPFFDRVKSEFRLLQ